MALTKPVKPVAKAAIKAQIEENLKRAYEEVLVEEVPDRLRELLDQLKAKAKPASEVPK